MIVTADGWVADLFYNGKRVRGQSSYSPSEAIERALRTIRDRELQIL